MNDDEKIIEEIKEYFRSYDTSAGPFRNSKEVASILRIPSSTVIKWRYVNRGPKWGRFGNRKNGVLYHIDEVRKFFYEHPPFYDNPGRLCYYRAGRP